MSVPNWSEWTPPLFAIPVAAPPHLAPLDPATHPSRRFTMTPRSGLAWSLALALGCILVPPSVADEKPAPAPVPAPTPTPTNIDIDMIRSRLSGGGGSSDSNDPGKYRPFADLTAHATRHDGLFTLYQKDD